MAQKKDKGRGSITVSKNSKEAKRIEDTHGFNKAQKAKDDRDQRAAESVATPGDAAEDK